MIRALLICGLSLVLAACNMAQSPTPVFGERAGAGAPRLRDGIWRIGDLRCVFRDSKPIRQWPKCATWGEINGNQLLVTNPGQIQGRRGHPYLLVPGPILLAQVETDDGETSHYGYFGVRVVRSDRAGNVVEASIWPVLCGPPPRGAAMPQNAMIGKLQRTDAPFPGLAMADEDEDCAVADPATVRQAARLSETLVEPIHARWVRDRTE